MNAGRKCMAAAVVVLSVSALFAQDGPPKGNGQPPKKMNASDIVAVMQKDLSLTAAQASQVKPVIEKEIAQMDALMEQERSGKLDRESARPKMDAIRKSTEDSLAGILTKEQLKKWLSRPAPGKEGK